MDRAQGYQLNGKWLQWFAPFRDLSVSAAYLTPFFLQNGLSLSATLALQSIFSAVLVLLDIPSGRFADKHGRAFSIKLSVPIGAVAMVAYGFSHHFWQFAILEVLLAVSKSLVSGADTALLTDSLHADNRGNEYVKTAQRIDGLSFAGTAIGLLVAVGLVHYFGIGSTLIADGILSAAGFLFVLRLVEAPHSYSEAEEEQRSLRQVTVELSKRSDVRWLVVLSSVLGVSTLMAFWFAAPYYTALGISTEWFGAILALRSAWKALLSHWPRPAANEQRALVTYAALAGLVYLAMASRQLWLMWAVLGHDIVQARARQPLIHRLNRYIDPWHRAGMNSVINLVQRLVFTVAGPLAGLLIDGFGLRLGFAILGIICSAVAFVALSRLIALNAFHERR